MVRAMLKAICESRRPRMAASVRVVVESFYLQNLMDSGAVGSKRPEAS